MTTTASRSDQEAVAPMALVEVYTVTDPNLAEIIKATLQREGISCWIDGENQAGLSGVLNITLRTRAKDAERAHRVVRTFDH